MVHQPDLQHLADFFTESGATIVGGFVRDYFINADCPMDFDVIDEHCVHHPEKFLSQFEATILVRRCTFLRARTKQGTQVDILTSLASVNLSANLLGLRENNLCRMAPSLPHLSVEDLTALIRQRIAFMLHPGARGKAIALQRRGWKIHSCPK